MGLKCGIVGLPNVGKSTLFNALGSAKAEAANYPFCTIEPNVGVFGVPDGNLAKIAKIVGSEKLIPATVQIVDIAGIVKGASKGEGLGNKFLTHIRETDAIIHLVRCFYNDDIVHVDGGVDPARDIEVINTELLLADLETVDKRMDKERRAAKSGDPEARKNAEIFEGLRAHMDAGNPVRTFKIDPMDVHRVAELFLLTAKPILYVSNSSAKPEEMKLIETVKQIAQKEGARHLTIDCSLESEIATLPEEERAEYLAGLGLDEPGLNRLIREAFDLLGLITYYSAGPKEVHAWTITKGTRAPQAAGVIHTDLEKKFIRADCIKTEDLLRLGSEAKVKEQGLMKSEGKEYVVHAGDIMVFR